MARMARMGKMKKIIHKELSFKIMDAVFTVHNELGPGYSEGIYESALAKEFKERGIKYERQKLIKVSYKKEKVGEYRLDMVVENKTVLELKAVSALAEIFGVQLLSYLKATGLKLGILINFGSRKVEYKRVVN